MARIGWIHHRLQVWQRWVLTRGGGRLGFAAIDLTSPTHGEGTASAIVPADSIEASDTHDAVMQLPRELMTTVVEYYIGPGDERRKCDRLAIHKATLHARLERADKLLVDLFAERSGRGERSEALAAPSRAQALAEFVDRVELLVDGALIADAIDAPELLATPADIRARDSEGGFTD